MKNFWKAYHRHIFKAVTIIIIATISIVAKEAFDYSFPSESVDSRTIATTEIKAKGLSKNITPTNSGSGKQELEITMGNKIINENKVDAAKPLQRRVESPKQEVNNNSGINIGNIGGSGNSVTNNITGLIPRHLDDQDISQIRQMLPDKSQYIRVVAILGDQESYIFASELKQFLLHDNYKNIDGVDRVMYDKPIFGQGLQKTEKGYDLIIGSLQ